MAHTATLCTGIPVEYVRYK